MEVTLDHGFVFFDGSPRTIIAFYKNFTEPVNAYTYDPDFYPSYIFIPKNIQSVSYKVQVNALQLTNPAGNPVSSKLIQTGTDNFQIRKLLIDSAESGKIWKTTISGNYNYSFLTITDRYFLLEKK